MTIRTREDTTHMRKLTALVAAATLVTGLTACTSTATDTTATTGVESPAIRLVVYHVASSTGRTTPQPGEAPATAKVVMTTQDGVGTGTITLPMDKPIGEPVPQGQQASVTAELNGTGWIDCWMEVIDQDTGQTIGTVDRTRNTGTNPQVKCATVVL